ncbi:MAG: hypothetical protein MJ233_00545 [Mycoplasmoidaceae bacterium]|nr:hypothetical protein [Mycoplasmoidaceae bacterium]
MDHLQYFKDLALENYTNLNNAMAGDLIEDVPVCDYEPYVYKEDDKIRNQVIESYTNLGIQPVLTKIHGGIECA